MRRIRFAPEMIEAIKQGKTMTFRITKRRTGPYIVEEGGHPYYKHIEAGIVIDITRVWKVHDTHEYATKYYKQEGFGSPAEFEEYLAKIHNGWLPGWGYAHLFKIIEKEADRA